MACWRPLAIVASLAGCTIASAGCTLLADLGSFGGDPAEAPALANAEVDADVSIREAAPTAPVPDASSTDAGVVADASQDAADGAVRPPFTLTTPTGSYQVNEAGSTVCSSSSTVAASLVFRNERVSPFKKEWVDQTCGTVTYANVNPGTQEIYDTYVGHRWRVRGLDDKVIVDFTVKAPGVYTLVVY